jgi:putative heme-binding domain-containing protein
VFVAAEVESPAAASAEFSAGSDEGLVVWVNGKKAFERLDNKTFPTDGFRFPAEVKAGKNLVVAKINQSSGPWEFIMSWSPPGTGRLFKPAGKATDPAEFVKFALTTTGNPDKGLAVYADLKGAGCVKCHVSGSPGTGGGDVGPSLVGVGAKYNREQLIESVLYPSKLIFDGYHQTRVATADGQVKLGLVRGETSTELTLVDSEGKKIVIKKADIDERRELAQSIMPEGLQTGLTPQDFADLIAYLESLKQKPEGGK